MPTAFTDNFLKNLATPGRYSDRDTRGLSIQIKEQAGKYWTFRYLKDGTRRDLSLGAYPAVTLKEARRRATQLRSQLYDGRSPEPNWKVKENLLSPIETERQKPVLFSQFAVDCVEAKRSEWRNKKHGEQWLSTLQTYAFPIIGDKSLDEVELEDILEILSPIWASKTETASRLRGRLEWIFAAAITRRLRKTSNPAAWRGLLATVLPKPNKVKQGKHHAALPFREIPSFIKTLQGLTCTSALALEFLILNASRTGEVIGALRTEVNESSIWTIPGSRMKAGKPHRIALTPRSQDILAVARSEDPGSEYLFSKEGRPLSNMALLALMRRLNIPFCVHGFRSSFRDFVSEMTEHRSEVAEMALAHAIPSKTEAAYRRGDLLEPRRALMTDWENHCLSRVNLAEQVRG
jgi:integrase